MPMSWAVAMMLLMPISCPSLTATEFTLLAKALFSGIESPEKVPLAFVGVHICVSFFFLSYTSILMYSSRRLSQGVRPWFMASV